MYSGNTVLINPSKATVVRVTLNAYNKLHVHSPVKTTR